MGMSSDGIALVAPSLSLSLLRERKQGGATLYRTQDSMPPFVAALGLVSNNDVT